MSLGGRRGRQEAPSPFSLLQAPPLSPQCPIQVKPNREQGSEPTGGRRGEEDIRAEAQRVGVGRNLSHMGGSIQ